jgi:hypothetical protein
MSQRLNKLGVNTSWPLSVVVTHVEKIGGLFIEAYNYNIIWGFFYPPERKKKIQAYALLDGKAKGRHADYQAQNANCKTQNAALKETDHLASSFFIKENTFKAPASETDCRTKYKNFENSCFWVDRMPLYQKRFSIISIYIAQYFIVSTVSSVFWQNRFVSGQCTLPQKHPQCGQEGLDN